MLVLRCVEASLFSYKSFKIPLKSKCRTRWREVRDLLEESSMECIIPLRWSAWLPRLFAMHTSGAFLCLDHRVESGDWQLLMSRARSNFERYRNRLLAITIFRNCWTDFQQGGDCNCNCIHFNCLELVLKLLQVRWGIDFTKLYPVWDMLTTRFII